MKNFILIIITLLLVQNITFSEEIQFDNDTYTLKFSAIAPSTQGYGNEYFKNNEDISNWTKMLGIYYYPNEDNPLKYAQDFDKTVEKTENSVLLKLIENKKENKSVISFLVNGSENSKKYFEYDMYKFEKYQPKGMLVVKYANKLYFKDNNEIVKIAKQIKENNDKYLELFIISQTPKLVEKDLPKI